MGERQGPDFIGERFDTLAVVQESLARRGFTFLPVPREHTEAVVTGPLLHRIRTQVKKRGFENVAARTIFTFSGFANDPREIYAIPDIRTYWQRLDHELPELPALLAHLPELQFNGPGQHLLLLGEIDAVIERPAIRMYDVHVLDAPRIIDDATRRIRKAAGKYHLSQTVVANLVDHFVRGARYHR